MNRPLRSVWQGHPSEARGGAGPHGGRHHRRGSSSARAREAGYHAIQFDAVVETNAGAFRLWQRLGCRIIGTVREAFDAAEHGLVGLHVMYLHLRERQG